MTGFISEKDIESYFTGQIKRLGGKAFKFVSPGAAGVPDRLVLLPGGRMCFCELKAPGKKARPLQLRQHDRIRALGFSVFVCDSKEQVDYMLDWLRGGV